MAVLDTTKYLDAVCRMLEDGEVNVPVPVTGVSMQPFLRNGDFAYLEPIREPVKKGDIVLYQRRHGQYILHRVYRLREGGFWMLGDSHLKPEPVDADQLRGKVAFVRCGGRDIHPGDRRWWLFAYPWRWLAPWRKQIYQIRAWTQQRQQKNSRIG